jgi:hypothetical protein
MSFLKTTHHFGLHGSVIEVPCNKEKKQSNSFEKPLLLSAKKRHETNLKKSNSLVERDEQRLSKKLINSSNSEINTNKERQVKIFQVKSFLFLLMLQTFAFFFIFNF